MKLLSNDMDERFAAASIPVANVEGAFDSTEMVRFVSSPWGRVPVAVDRACRLLDITCRAGSSNCSGTTRPTPAPWSSRMPSST